MLSRSGDGSATSHLLRKKNYPPVFVGELLWCEASAWVQKPHSQAHVEITLVPLALCSALHSGGRWSLVLWFHLLPHFKNWTWPWKLLGLALMMKISRGLLSVRRARGFLKMKWNFFLSTYYVPLMFYMLTLNPTILWSNFHFIDEGTKLNDLLKVNRYRTEFRIQFACRIHYSFHIRLQPETFGWLFF